MNRFAQSGKFAPYCIPYGQLIETEEVRLLLYSMLPNRLKHVTRFSEDSTGGLKTSRIFAES